MKLRVRPPQSYAELRERARSERGWLYLLWDPNSRWFKIGWTLREPEARLAEIREEFGGVFNWQLVGQIPCLDPPAVEEVLHRWLADGRVSPRREWFVLPDDEAHAVVAIFQAYQEGGG